MEKEIGKINKNDTTDIVVRLDDFGGRLGLTIREFVTSDRYTGFTKSGVRILAGDFKKFKEMVNSISEDDLKSEESPEDNQQRVPTGPEETPENNDKNGNGKEELPDY